MWLLLVLLLLYASRPLELLEKLRDKRVSELVLAELASIVSRRRNVLHKTLRRIRARDELAVPVVLLYVLKRFGLEYRIIDGRGHIYPLGRFLLAARDSHRAVI